MELRGINNSIKFGAGCEASLATNPYLLKAACKNKLDFLLLKCSFNLIYKSFALPIYCLPLAIFIKE